MKTIGFALALLAPASIVAAASGTDAFFDSLLNIQRKSASAFGALRFITPETRPALNQAEREQIDLFEKSRQAVVAIRVRGAQGSGSGSGFIAMPDGLVVTAAHVVAHSAGPTVTLETATRGHKTARIVAVSNARDIALLKIVDTFNDWPAFDVSHPSLSATGAYVFAIGNPLDSGIALSRGSVSNVRQPGNSPWIDFIQADIMINPGNSGGALVDTSGRLVGMNTSVARNETIDGLAYAVPAADIALAIAEYRATGQLVDPYTTLTLEPTALTVLTSKPLHHLAPGDAIVGFAGFESADPRRRRNLFFRLFGHSRPGGVVPVDVVRGVAVKLISSPGAAQKPTAEISIAFNPATGTAFAAPSPQLDEFFNAVSDRSVEFLEYAGRFYAVEPVGEPNSKTGLLLKIKDGAGWIPAVIPAERVLLPVEEMPARDGDGAQT